MRPRRLHHALALLAFLTQACGSTPAPTSQADIYQGRLDTEHEAVGLLVRDGKLWCTATLIEAKIAISAGHCFEGKSQLPAELQLHFRSGELVTRVSEVVVHPDYSDWFGRVTHDVAILKLQDTVDLPPMPLASRAPSKGTSVLFVGYGYTDAKDKASLDGTRRQGSNVLGSLDTWKLYFPKPTDASTAQVCRGDSGGPIFAREDDRLVQIGIVSGSTDGAAQKTCLVSSYAARVDAHLDWIQSQL